MPDPVEPTSSLLEATYKGREFEGVLDLYFYRRIGFRMARFFARLGMTPSAVTLLGGLFGILAGHLYYYGDLRLNLLGMLLHVCANVLDNADGQLARLTNSQSRKGRIIDSVVDHVIFISVYAHLGLRCLNEGASPAIWLLTLAAALSHALQASAADYSRNAFLYFVKGRSRAYFESHEELLGEFRQLRWSEAPLDKLLLGIYLNATRQQELFSPGLVRLKQTVTREFAPEIPAWWQARYRDVVGPTFRLWGFLMTNTRMLLLFAVLILDRPAWFFWAEVTVFNLLFLVLIFQQTKMSKSLLGLATSDPKTA
jgi:CDP-alcohol phosphatidyltransferase-like enzyme